jgi:antitoxin component YwqK of YwqJK toxin-antitoxin module
MKKFISIIISALVLLAPLSLDAQNSACENSYFAFKKGVSMELTHYDKKGKPTAITKQKVLDVSEDADGFKATIEMENTDEKGKRPSSANFDITCKGNSVFVDMRSMLNPESMASTQEMELEVTGDAMEFPNMLTPGQTLPDGHMEMKASMNGMKLMTIKLFISNRKVEGTETVTTPAGSFECVKMTQDTEMQSIFKMNARTTTWYAKGVGMVKTENYDKNGKLDGTTVLTKFEN